VCSAGIGATRAIIAGVRAAQRSFHVRSPLRGGGVFDTITLLDWGRPPSGRKGMALQNQRQNQWVRFAKTVGGMGKCSFNLTSGKL
jgi:hypothetical protein